MSIQGHLTVIFCSYYLKYSTVLYVLYVKRDASLLFREKAEQFYLTVIIQLYINFKNNYSTVNKLLKIKIKHFVYTSETVIDIAKNPTDLNLAGNI